MIQMQFNSVSASEAGDYFQVLFEQDVDNPEARYFLVQCQFEFPDKEGFYIESDDTRLGGLFEVKTATLSRQSLRLGMPSTNGKSSRFNSGQMMQVTKNWSASWKRCSKTRYSALIRTHNREQVAGCNQ
jgi:hypothetical protein